MRDEEEYNLSNPSAAEEDRMIQDKIDEDYAYREAYDKYMAQLQEEEYYRMEEEYYRQLQEETK